VERAAAARLAAERARLPRGAPRTRAERTSYAETSRHADVLAFLDTLARLAPGALRRQTLGASPQGRALPLVVASRPAVATPEEARRLGRPVVLVQANIHAGEAEGKEAVQALLRDLALDPRPNVLDSLVLLAVPVYNADGNEALAPQAVNRTEQNGPELVGRRPNGQGLDLNRDYVKAEAPETRASLALFARWAPDAFVDLHTTDGSYHGYALTWSPSLHPSAPLGPYVRDTLLPAVAARVRARWGLATFPYGNFATEYGADVTPDTTKQGWFTYEHVPRFGTNYYGLRGPVSVLSEAYSHDPFERRVRATYAFVGELLSALAADGAGVRARVARAAAPADSAALGARLTTRPRAGPVIAEDLARTGDSAVTEPGVPSGAPAHRAASACSTCRSPTASRPRARPACRRAAGRSTPAPRARPRRSRSSSATASRCGASARRATRTPACTAPTRWWSRRAPSRGTARCAWQARGGRERRALSAGAFVVPARQPLAALALVLLDPETDDGLVTWNVWDRALRPGADFPVVRLAAP
jgi:hypothetical protein